ncbi:hypothetical protein A9Q89_03640 [Gammaproteobacteria bacterium 53_120_T64]|nr:hypothetical protein A9Q89_03640 [Gammaproteobacteria bacterium 53_120_T64]
MLGRLSSRETTDIAVQHRRVSRPTKQTRPVRQRGGFWIEDRGSANGTDQVQHECNETTSLKRPTAALLRRSDRYG